MDRPLICSSLRKRCEWAGLTTTLLQSKNTCGAWKETKLDSHDLAIPIKLPTASPMSHRGFCAVLMTPSDVGTSEARRRNERLYHFGAGKDVGIIFLLKSGGDQQNAVATLMTLQLELANSWPLPIIPVDSVAAVPATLQRLQQQLVTGAAKQDILGSARGLLPFCTESKQPLTEHTVNILTDVTSGFRDLVNKVSSGDDADSEIAQFLGQETEKLKMFWNYEYLVD